MFKTLFCRFAPVTTTPAPQIRVVSGHSASGSVDADTVVETVARNENFDREAAEAAVLASPSTLDLRHLCVLDVDLIVLKMRERFENGLKTKAVVVSPEGQRSLAGGKIACVSSVWSPFGEADIFTMRTPPIAVETVANVIFENFATESSVTLVDGRTITVAHDPEAVQELAGEIVAKLVAEGVIR